MSILDKSSLVMIPSGYKEDILYSVKPRNGEGDFTFTRASTGTRVNADGFIEEVPWNKSTYSEDFTNGNYVKNNCVVIADQADSPTGTTTADQIDFGSGSGFFYNASTAITQPSTYSVYVKYIDYQFIQIIGTGDVDHYANFDIQNGIVGNTGSQSTASIVDAGNGWYRCIINYNSGTFAGGARLYKTTSLTASWAGGGGVAGSFYFWGNQLVKGNSPKPYIKTTDRLDIPRLDYSGGATTPTLLLEPQRTNIVPYTEDFSQWGAINSNRTLINNTNPIDSNAYEIESSVTSSASRIYYSAIMTAGNDYSSTYLVKPSLNSPEYLGFACISNTQPDVLYDFANDQFVDFNIVGNAAKCESISMNNGWKLLKVPVHESVLNTRLNIYQGSRVGNNLYGTTGESYYIKFAQLEQGNYTTSYIPTNGTSVTRVADVSETSGLSDYIGQSEGSFIIDFKCPTGGGGQIYIWNGTIQERLVINIRESNTRIDALAVVGNSLVANENLFDQDTTQRTIYGIRYRENDFEIWVNGVLKATETGTFSFWSAGTLDQFDFNDYNNTAKFVGNVNKVIFTNTYPTDEEMQQLTTI